jgi:membrane fusion protein, copper/silver efflux system
MKNLTLGLLLLGVLGVGFLAGSWSNQRERVSAAGLRARRILYYVDPMHPAYKSEKPGVAPDCGMALEPIYEDGELRADLKVGPYTHNNSRVSADHQHCPVGADLQVGPTGGIHISPSLQQMFGVRVRAAERRSITERLRLYGRVATDETRVYSIDVGIDGFIRQLSRVTTGSRVHKDEWLATFSAPEARSPIQSYLVALDVLERARSAGDGPTPIELATAAVQQSVDRLMTIGMSTEQIAEVARTRQVPFNIRIAAPADGFVVARNVSTGQKFERGDELFRVADLRRVWIEADVFGGDAKYVKPGAAAEVFLPGRTQSVRARVSPDVLPQFDAANQSVTVRLEAENRDYLLRPDMFVDVELIVTLPPALAVPADAVLDAGVRRTVFVERSEGLFESRTVETGWRFGSLVEIVRGLQPGERVVVAGTFLLDSESRMRHPTSPTEPLR